MQKISAHHNKCSYRKTLRERHGYCEEDHGAPYEIQQWRSETTISYSVSFAKRIKETKKYEKRERNRRNSGAPGDGGYGGGGGGSGDGGG